MEQSGVLVGLIKVFDLDSLSDFDRGWISALIDGEGSIRLRKRNDSATYKPSLAVSNTSRELLEKLAKKIPDTKIYSETREKEDWQNPYQLVVWKHDTIKLVLEDVKDDLVIKKDKADLMIKFLELRAESSRSRGANGKFTSSTKNPEEDEIFEKFKQL